MRFLIDAQLSPALARWLRDQGHEAEHVTELDMGSDADANIYKAASERAAILVTKDADFVQISRRASGSQVLWIRVGNSSSAELLGMLSLRFDQLCAALQDGERIVQFRR